MNAKRRKKLVTAQDILEAVKERLEELLEEEEEARDNLPENLLNSERYERAEAACNNITSAIDSLEEAMSYIEEAAQQ